MKRITFTIIALALVVFTVNAQHTELIIRFGPNLSQLRGNDLAKDKFQSIVGYTGGVFVRQFLKSHAYLSAGLQYERNGYAIRNLTFTDQSGSNLRKGDLFNVMNYLVLPLMGEYRNGNRIKYSIKGGPFFSYLMNLYTKIKWDDDGPDEQLSANTRELNRFNFGIGAGAAIDFPIGKKLGLEFSIEDHLGLYDVSSNRFPSGKKRTNALNLTAGLIYSLK